MISTKIETTLFNPCSKQKRLRLRRLITNESEKKFDVIIIGDGHTEASAAAIKRSAKTRNVMQISSFGGIGKGHLMREMDALGGTCCQISDFSEIDYKVLNKCKESAIGMSEIKSIKHYTRNIFRRNFSLCLVYAVYEFSMEDLT